jgi:hypothetical protein
LLRHLHGVVHQVTVLIQRIAGVGQVAAAGELGDLIQYPLLFVEAIAQALLGLLWIEASFCNM